MAARIHRSFLAGNRASRRSQPAAAGASPDVVSNCGDAPRHRASSVAGGTYSRYVGRVGALAVALGVGIAVATSPGMGLGVARAQTDGEPNDTTQNTTAPAPDNEPATPPDNQITEQDDEHEADQAALDQAGLEQAEVENEQQELDQHQQELDGVGGDKQLPAVGPTTPTTTPSPTTPTTPDAPAPLDATANGTETVAPPTIPDTPPPGPAAGDTPAPADLTGGLAPADLDTPIAADTQSSRFALPEDPGSQTQSLMAAATAPGTPAPAPLINQPSNPIEVLFGAPFVLTKIALTAVSMFFSGLFTPGPSTPSPPVLLFVVLGWAQRELRRTFLNESPTAVVDAVTTSEDTDVTITVLANDTDPDLDAGDVLTVSDYTQPANGSVTLNPDGTFTYTPAAGFDGTDIFTYTLTDEASRWHIHGLAGFFGGGHHASTTTVSVTVTPVTPGNQAPVADNDTATVDESASVAIDVLAGDTDPDGNSTIDKTTITVTDQPANGTTSIDPVTGVITYTHNGSETLTDTFTYTVNDTTGATSNTATVTVTITPVNDAPVAVDDTKTTNEDVALSFPATDLVANDTDPENNPRTITAVSNPTNGTVTLNAGTITFTPTANYNGPASFTYTVSDGTLTDTGTVTVTVNPVNDAPVASNDTVTVPEDSISVFNLANSSFDRDGDTLTAVLISGPANAQTFTLNPNRTFTYAPAANFNGTDSFTYKVNDGLLDSNTVTVTINTTPTNDAPIANSNVYTVDEDKVLTVPVANGVRVDDTDIDNAVTTLTVTIDEGVDNGLLALNADGSFTYTPNANFNGTDSFTYHLADPAGGISNTTTATITVNPVIDGTVIATIPAGDFPAGLAMSPNGDRLYIANSLSSNVTVINTATNAVVTTIPLSSGTTVPRDIAISPDGNFVYVTNAGSNTVSVINTSSNTVVATIPVAGAPWGVAVNGTGSLVYVTNSNANSLSVIDTASNTIVSTIPVGAGPREVIVRGTRAYVSNITGNSVSVINTSTNTVVATISVPTNPLRMVMGADGSQLYVATLSGNVSVIDTTSNTVSATIPAGGTNYWAVTLSPDGTRLYVASPGPPSRIYVVDTATNTVITSVDPGNGPTDVVVHPDGTRIFTSNANADTVSVITFG